VSGESLSDRDRKRRLLMAAIDGELSGAERAEFDRMVSEDPELKREWEELSRVKEVTDTMSLKRPPEEVWDTYWVSVYNKLERGFGWILISLGLLVLVSFGIWHGVQDLLADTGVPPYIKIAIFAVCVGTVILLVSVIREKWFVRKRDPYKEVER
jgi:ferric-dicitrate binding protein FerR (iron transport regulator)